MSKHKQTSIIIVNLRQYYIDCLSKYLPHLAIISLMIVLLFTSNCTQIEELEGGPKDTIPPQLIDSYPLHESTGFKGQKLKLTFDKAIEIQDIYNRLIVTPKLARLENKPSYICKVKGNVLEINLEAPLEGETTYTFNFKDAIRDTRERTAANNPTLTFSTGNYVDSMYVAGQIKYLMTDQPVSDALVALYKITDADTSHILNTSPDYFIKTNQNGDFKLEHIKQGKYRLCAGYSKESKLILDPSKDLYGFLETTLEIFRPVDSISLYILQADVTEFKLQSSQPQEQYFEINFSKRINKYTLQLAHQSKRFKDAQLFSHLIENGLAIRVYNTLGLLEDDMLEAKLRAQDNMGNVIEESINIHFRDKLRKKELFKYTIQPPEGVKVNPELFKVDIAFNKPIKSIQLENLFFVVGQTDTLKLNPEEVILHPQKDSITIKKEYALVNWIKSIENDTIHNEKLPSIDLNISKGAFISVEKELNEAAHYKYLIKNPQECGTIKGKVITKVPGFIIQLLNKDYVVIEEIRNKIDYEFKDVLPGNYRLRVLVLQEREGQWNFGNINKSQPPDRVIFYPHELAIVANWELDYIDFII